MTDPETTLPPRKPNTLKTWLPRIWAFLWLHKDYTIPAGCFLIGIAVGKII